MSINITESYTNKYSPVVLSKVKINSTGDYISLSEDNIENISSEEVVLPYVYENFPACPPKNIIKLVSGKTPTDPNILLGETLLTLNNASLDINYFIDIVFKNIWKYVGADSPGEGNAGFVKLQFGYFGLSNKTTNLLELVSPRYIYEGGLEDIDIAYSLVLNLVKTDEEALAATSGITNWKDKVLISASTTDKINILSSGYEGLSAYKIHFDWKGTTLQQGADIEYFTQKTSDLNLSLTFNYKKRNKALGLTSKVVTYKVPVKLTIVNELIQCHPAESYLYDDLSLAYGYGVKFNINTNEQATQLQIGYLKIWCPNTDYLTQEISAFGSGTFYDSIEITDYKKSVRQFKLVINKGTTGQTFRLIFHLRYLDNKGVEYEKDYNILFENVDLGV